MSPHWASITATCATSARSSLPSNSKPVLRLDQCHAARFHGVAAARFGRHAGTGPRTPIDRRRRQALRTAGVGQRIEERIAGRVVRLARRAEHAGHRRKQHEEIERLLAAWRRADSTRRATFGGIARSSCSSVISAQDAVGQHAGRMNDAAQRRRIRRKLRQRGARATRRPPRRR